MHIDPEIRYLVREMTEMMEFRQLWGVRGLNITSRFADTACGNSESRHSG